MSYFFNTKKKKKGEEEEEEKKKSCIWMLLTNASNTNSPKLIICIHRPKFLQGRKRAKARGQKIGQKKMYSRKIIVYSPFYKLIIYRKLCIFFFFF